MNEIISQLERVKEKATAKLVAVKVSPIRSSALDYRAIFEMACDHLTDTIYLFRHARKLKQKLEADSRLGSDAAPGGGSEWSSHDMKDPPVERREQDAPN